MTIQPNLELVRVSSDESFKAWSHGYPYRAVRWHYHPDYEIHFVTHTTDTFMVGDHVGSFAPDHLVLVGPNLPHNWVSDLRSGEAISQRCVVLQFTGGSLAAATIPFPELTDLQGLLLDARRGVEFGSKLCHGARDLLTALVVATGVRRLVLFLDLLDRLARDGSRRLFLSPAYWPDPDRFLPNIMNQVLTYIGDHLESDLSQAKLAAMFGQSPSAFSRLFQKHTAMSYSQYVQRLRVDHTCHLLISTGKPVSDICCEAGFNNLSNFNRRFRDYKGMPPSKFRAAQLSVATSEPASSAGGLARLGSHCSSVRTELGDSKLEGRR